MQKLWKSAAHVLVWCCAWAWAQAQPLVSAQWLQEQQKAKTVQLIDTRFSKAYAQSRLPGAFNLDVLGMSFRGQDPGAEMAKLAKLAGLQAEHPIVIYDAGADMNATSLYFDLHRLGYPMARVHVLDGGFGNWQQSGASVAQSTPTQASATVPSNFGPGAARNEVLAQLGDVLGASGRSQSAVLVEALQPSYFYASAGYFDRKGHVPHAKLMAHSDFFGADGRFKSTTALRAMFAHQGVKGGEPLISYCGGGIAASVPWFAAHALLGQSHAKLYKASLMEYTRDDRQLPLWSYGDETLRRSPNFVSAWTNPSFSARAQGQAKALDVRDAAAFAVAHVAASLSLPATEWPRQRSANEWEAALRAQGVSAQHEVIILSDGGITPAAAWAWWLSVQSGQAKVSIAWESPDEFTLAGIELQTSAATAVPRGAVAAAPRATPMSNGPSALPAPSATQWIATAAKAGGISASAPSQALRLPLSGLLDGQQKPLSASALWATLNKAGVSRFLPIVVQAPDPAEAAVLVYLLRLMGFATARVG